MKSILLPERDFGVHEECGIYGVTSSSVAPRAGIKSKVFAYDARRSISSFSSPTLAMSLLGPVRI